MPPRRPLPAIALTLICAAVAGCGGADSSTGPAAGTGKPTGAGFAATLDAARGQTVRWWMYGGDHKVNAYVDDIVAPAARRLGVRIERVPIADTADAVQRVVAERRAGTTAGGSVDLIWINGENFAAGKDAGLWLESWATRLPNSRYLDQADPATRTDFQVPVDGQESPWQRAAFVFAHDSRRVAAPPRDLDGLLAYARAHPGRVTYPAPPDFTGSAFVRQVVAAKGEDAAFAYLEELRPFTYRGGETYPKSEAELSRLFGDGQVDFAMSYDPAFVNSGVRRGQFPRTARPFRLGDGSLQNTSFVTIPANASSPEGAQVVANLLLSPRLQAIKADPESIGNPTVLDLDRLGDRRGLFAATEGSRYVLSDYGRTLGELAAGRVEELERRWTLELLRGSP